MHPASRGRFSGEQKQKRSLSPGFIEKLCFSWLCVLAGGLSGHLDTVGSLKAWASPCSHWDNWSLRLLLEWSFIQKAWHSGSDWLFQQLQINQNQNRYLLPSTFVHTRNLTWLNKESKITVWVTHYCPQTRTRDYGFKFGMKGGVDLGCYFSLEWYLILQWIVFIIAFLEK